MQTNISLENYDSTLIAAISNQVLKTVFTSLGLLGIIISSVIGFIFNCVVSIFITQLFLE